MFQMIDYIREEMVRFKNRPFLEATMACCALVAIADGEVSLSERSRVDDVLETLEQLRDFDVHMAVDLFNGYLDQIQQSPVEGRERLHQLIARFRETPKDADILIRVSVAISKADGEFALSELVCVKEICETLGLQPADYGAEMTVG